MKTGAMALARIQQADGRMKPRPVVVLQEMPPYRDLLVSTVMNAWVLMKSSARATMILKPAA